MERLQAASHELSGSEARRTELETQVRTSHNALVQRQEAEQVRGKMLQRATANN